MATSSVGGAPLDVNYIVTQLMQLESKPLDALNQKQASYKTMLSAYGTLKSDVSSLESAVGALKLPSAFTVFKATPADTTLMSASADGTAVAGNYTVSVTQRATAQTLKSADQASDTAGLGNAATTLDITVGSGSTVQVSIGANSTLQQIRDAINAANAGISATIIYNGTGYNLVYTAKDTGAANTITATTTDGTLAAIAGSASMTQTTAAQNASLTINGVAVSSASNTVTGAIQGVTLNLLKDSGTTTVNVTRDTASIESKISSFISAYNQLIKDINYLHVKGGKLEADNTVLSIQNQINGTLNTSTGFSAAGGYDYLAQIGITRQSDGTLALDTATFESALSSNYNGVVQLFTDSTNGVATRLYSQASQMIGTDGLITSRSNGLNSSITDIQNRIDAFNVRLNIIEQRLTRQYSNLNAMLASMNQTSSFLTQRLG